MLIDTCLKDYDFTRAEHIIVNAPPQVTYEAARALDFMTVRSPLTDALMWLRGLPQRLRRRAPQPPKSMKLDDLKSDESQWVLLGEEPGQEVVFGAVGRFWQPTIEWRLVADFTSFDEPGYGKIAANFSVRPYGEGRTLLSYETRTKLTDARSRAKFRLYWTVVSPGVGLILATSLRTIKRDAELCLSPAPAPAGKADLGAVSHDAP